MNLDSLKAIFKEHGCEKLYVKVLAANDNSKNQVYLGGGFEVLNIFPLSDIQADASGSRKTETFKATLPFAWITEDAILSTAPHAQFILYPEYPEVRFSGFLLRSSHAPSELMTSRTPGRLLILGVSKLGVTLGYVASPTSDLATQFLKEKDVSDQGVFKVIFLSAIADSKSLLVNKLREIHKLGWIDSIRLNSDGQILSCNSPNCGGYTLEAKLGITPNGYSEPDFHGWEVKQFGVDNFEKLQSATITLMTPEPTGGFYTEKGVEAFIRKYGYADKQGRADRMNFGGTHFRGKIHPLTNLELSLIGYDSEKNKITDSDGRIALLDSKQNEAASWSFASMLKHWNRKHNLACYVPSKSQTTPARKYCYGDRILLGNTTDFSLFLKEMYSGNIYYDPGIKMENISVKTQIKRRSQFRIKSRRLPSLYQKAEFIDLKA